MQTMSDTTTVARAAQRLTRVPDVLALLSDQIENRRLLLDLCLVNRQFHATFGRKLWRRLEFNETNDHHVLDDEKRRRLVSSSQLQHTRVFVMWQDLGFGWVAGDMEASDAILDLIEHIPYLGSFAAYGLKLRDRLFNDLSRRSSLESLVVAFDPELTEWLGMVDEPNFDDLPAPRRMARDVATARQELVRRIPRYLQQCRSLKRLTLMGLWGLVEVWQTALLGILRHNPGLEHLTLSLGHGAVELANVSGDYRLGVSQCRWFRFFTDLCRRYGEAGLSRLKLRSLRLDRHISFPALSSLERLTVPAYLQDVHLNSEHTIDKKWPIYCDALFPSATPALRQLSCDSLCDEILDHAESLFDAAQPRDLALRSSVWRCHFPESTDESGTDGPLYNGCRDEPISRLLVWDLDLFRSRREISPFQHGDAITHLGLQVSIELWDSLYEEAAAPLARLREVLDALPNLEALWLISDTCAGMTKYRPLPRPETAHADNEVPRSDQESLEEKEENIWEQKWPPQEEIEPCESHVFDAARACPRLLYMRVTHFAWRIRRGVTAGPREQSDIQVERLDDWEDHVECPDIFHSPPPLAWSKYVRHAEI